MLNDVGIISIGWDGLTVSGWSNDQSPTEADILELVAKLTEIPARVRLSERAEDASGGGNRTGDQHPFNGGAFTNGCSIGWPFRVGDAVYATTARHCGPASSLTPGAATSYGARIWQGNPLQVIQQAAGTSRFFSGDYNTYDTATMVGSGNLSLNDQLCTAGGNSGTHCGVVVKDVYVTIGDGYGPDADAYRAEVGPGAAGWSANNPATPPAAAMGDSGGPAFVAVGPYTAIAVGEIQKIAYPVDAQGNATPCSYKQNATQICGPTVYLSKPHSFRNEARLSLSKGVAIAFAGPESNQTRTNAAFSSHTNYSNGDVQTVTAAATPDGFSHKVTIGTDGRLYHQMRYSNGGLTGFGDVTTQGAKTRVSAVAVAATLDNGIQLIEVVDGVMFHQMRRPNGTWSAALPIYNTSSTSPYIVSIAGAGLPNGDTQWVAVDRGGNQYHLRRGYDPTESVPFSPLNAMSGVGSQGGVGAVGAAATLDGYFHVFSASGNAVQIHTRKVDGNWIAPVSIPNSNTQLIGLSGVGMSDGTIQILQLWETGEVRHRIRQVDGTWSSPGTLTNTDVNSVAISGDSNQPAGSSLKLVSQLYTVW